MHAITGNREEMLKVLRQTILHLQRDTRETQETGMAAFDLESTGDWQPQRDDVVETLQQAYDAERRETVIRDLAFESADVASAASSPPEREVWYAPRNQVIALFQSAMDEHLDRQAIDTGLAADVAEQFDTTDPGWIEVALEKIKTFFRGKAKFIKHQSATDFRFIMADQVRIALVSDWGTGNAQALQVRDQISTRNPDYLIHLGDVYYAGVNREIRERFLNCLPNAVSIQRRFALNSNHEMYSGGRGYFEVTLPDFQQPASYFSLGNQNWRLIGLDTGYVDHNLNKEQAEWLTSQLAESEVRTILLSHHQLFSAFEAQGDKLEDWLKEFLEAHRFAAWFWGHEHKCIVYSENNRFGLRGRCIGHGSIPFAVPSTSNITNTDFPMRFLDTKPRPDAPEHGIHGFALLTLNEASLHVDYIDQEGEVRFQEEL